MGASESIYGARGVESGAAEPEEQLMHRTPLGSALVANWQYVILAGGPHSGDPGPFSFSEDKSCEQELQQIRSLSSGDRSPERSSKSSTFCTGGGTS